MLVSQDIFMFIKDKLAYKKLRFEGLANINGGFCEIKKMKVKTVGQDIYSVSGIFIFGEQDCGEGGSSKYTENFKDCIVKVEGDDIHIVTKG